MCILRVWHHVWPCKQTCCIKPTAVMPIDIPSMLLDKMTSCHSVAPLCAVWMPPQIVLQNLCSRSDVSMWIRGIPSLSRLDFVKNFTYLRWRVSLDAIFAHIFCPFSIQLRFHSLPHLSPSWLSSLCLPFYAFHTHEQMTRTHLIGTTGHRTVEWRFGYMPVRRQPDTAY